MSEREFNPNEHMMKLKGKDYLPVAARVLWFRDEFPIEKGWSIDTKLVDGGFKEGYAVFVAAIFDPNQRVVARGHNVEDKQGFGDFMQKAETGAIGRALAAAGFGTMAALDEGPDNVIDSPVDRRLVAKGWKPEPELSAEGQPLGYPCEVCNCDVDYQTAGASRRKFNGKVFCIPHGREMMEGMKAQGALACQDCGQVITEKVASASLQGKGKYLCIDCGRKEKEASSATT